MSSKRLNQNAEIWFSTAPLYGIGSGRITSKAEMRSVATKSSVSPRSKTSRTFPLRSFWIPGSSIEDCVAICMGKCSTFNAQLSTRLLFCHVERSRDIAGFNFERFDSLTSRSLSLWPSRLCRGVPSCYILDSARNDRVTGGWTLGVRRWTFTDHGRSSLQFAFASCAWTQLAVRDEI